MQYAGEQPYNIEILSPYEACVSYKEGVVIAVVAGKLMNAAVCNEIPLVVSCTLVPKERMNAIVKVRGNVKGAWKDNGEREEESSEGGFSDHSSFELKQKIEQIATHEGDITKSVEKCMEQQT